MKVDGDDEAKFVFHSQEILAKANQYMLVLSLGILREFANIDETKNMSITK